MSMVWSWKKSLVALALLVALGGWLVLASVDQGIGQDDAAIILASIEISSYHFWHPANLGDHLVFRLFNYSHGWVNLVWTYFVYRFIDLVHIPFTTFTLILPSLLLVMGSIGLVGWWCWRITRQRWVAITSMALLATTPIILGLARSYTIQVSLALFMRILLFWCITEAVQRRSFRWQSGTMAVLALLIASENAFFFSGALAVVLVVVLEYWQVTGWVSVWQRMKQTMLQTGRFFFTPAVVLPVLVISWYIAAYFIEAMAPFGLGFFRYTFAHRAFFGLPNGFPLSYLEHVGYGWGLVISALLLGGWWLVKQLPQPTIRPVVLFLWVWAIVCTGLVLIYSPDNSLLYFSLAIPSLSFLGGLTALALWRYSPLAVLAVGLFLVVTQVLSLTAFVFDWPFRGPNLYGTPRNYHYSQTFQAVGTLLRQQGFNPATYRQLSPPPPRALLAGNKIGVTPYPALLYWGTIDGTIPSANTEVIVHIPEWKVDSINRPDAIRFATENNFDLQSIIFRGTEPTAWIYHKVDDGQPVRQWQERDLRQQWSSQIKSWRDLLTSGLAGPHAL